MRCELCRANVGGFLLCSCKPTRGCVSVTPCFEYDSNASTVLRSLQRAAVDVLKSRLGKPASDDVTCTVDGFDYTVFCTLFGARQDEFYIHGDVPSACIKYTPATLNLKTFSVRNANYNKRIHTLLLDSKGIARLLNLHNVCSTLDKHGGFETAIVSPTTGSVCGAVCWKGGGSGTLEHISDKKRGTDKVKLSFSTFRLDGEQSPDLSPKLSRLLLDDKASSETALAKTAFAYAVTWPSRARDSVGLTNHKNKRKRQPVDSADAPNMYDDGFIDTYSNSLAALINYVLGPFAGSQ